MKLKNAISHKQFWRSAIEVKDEQLPLSIKTEYGWEMACNAPTWTERSNPSWHARFGLVGAAAMHDLHVIQGPNVTRDAREKIAFFAFHAFVVEDSRLQQNRVRAKLYNCCACVCKSNVEIRIADSFCRPQLENTRSSTSTTNKTWTTSRLSRELLMQIYSRDKVLTGCWQLSIRDH